jgi:hypothetical protein
MSLKKEFRYRQNPILKDQYPARCRPILFFSFKPISSLFNIGIKREMRGQQDYPRHNGIMRRPYYGTVTIWPQLLPNHSG